MGRAHERAGLLALALLVAGCGEQAGDGTPPEVAITNLADGETLALPRVLHAEASDAGGVAHVEFFVDSASLGVVSREPFECTWDVGFWDSASIHSVWAAAVDEAGNRGESPVLRVGVAPGAVARPTLLWPADGDTVRDTRTTILRWSTVPGAAGYGCEVAGTPDFAAVVLAESTGDTSLTATLELGQWHWRVRARSAGGHWGVWCPPAALTLDGPSPPVLRRIESVSNWAAVVFAWTPAPHTTLVDLQIDDALDFNTPRFQSSTPHDSLVFALNSQDGPWYWRARARNAVGDWGVWSPPQSVGYGSLAGAWTFPYDWGCDGEDDRTTLFFHEDGGGSNVNGDEIIWRMESGTAVLGNAGCGGRTFAYSAIFWYPVSGTVYYVNSYLDFAAGWMDAAGDGGCDGSFELTR